jgi:hypothetical protein
MQLRFTRLDNGDAVDAEADLSFLPQDEAMEELIQRCLRKTASEGDIARVGRLWQERVRCLLMDCANDPGVFTVRRVEGRRPVMAPLIRPGLLVTRRLQAD